MINLAIAPTALYTPNVVKPANTPPATDTTLGDTFTPSQPMVAATNRDGVNWKELLFTGGFIVSSHLGNILPVSAQSNATSACWYKTGAEGAAVEFAQGVDNVTNCIEQFEHVCEKAATHVGVGTTTTPPTKWQKLTKAQRNSCG